MPLARLSDVGVRYVAKRVSLMGKKPREEKSDGREDPQQKKVEVGGHCWNHQLS